MGITEPRNTKQEHFCFLCNGPGIGRFDETRRICAKCRKVLQTWNVQPKLKQLPSRSFDEVTDSQKREYLVRRVEFLKDKVDVVAIFVFGKIQPATIVHHARGRKKHYLVEETWIATTPEGDRWVHGNPELAKELGFLCEKF